MMIWSIVVSLCLVISGSCQSDYESQLQAESDKNRMFGFGRGRGRGQRRHRGIGGIVGGIGGGMLPGIIGGNRPRWPGGGGGSSSSEERYYRDYQEPLDLRQLKTEGSDDLLPNYHYKYGDQYQYGDYSSIDFQDTATDQSRLPEQFTSIHPGEEVGHPEKENRGLISNVIKAGLQEGVRDILGIGHRPFRPHGNGGGGGYYPNYQNRNYAGMGDQNMESDGNRGMIGGIGRIIGGIGKILGKAKPAIKPGITGAGIGMDIGGAVNINDGSNADGDYPAEKDSVNPPITSPPKSKCKTWMECEREFLNSFKTSTERYPSNINQKDGSEGGELIGNNGAEVAATAGSWRTEGMNGGVELDSMQPSVVSGSFGNRGIGGRLRFG